MHGLKEDISGEWVHGAGSGRWNHTRLPYGLGCWKELSPGKEGDQISSISHKDTTDL
jgi:hypothetical protein